MKRTTRWMCEICGATYAARDRALRCEAWGTAREYPVGLIYGDHTAGSMYEKITFAVGRCSARAHFSHVSAWACRDNGAGDSTADSGEFCEGVVYTGTLNPEAPSFQRMVVALREKGIEPTVWLKGKVQPLAALKTSKPRRKRRRPRRSS